jgi:hypothetical protein
MVEMMVASKADQKAVTMTAMMAVEMVALLVDQKADKMVGK